MKKDLNVEKLVKEVNEKYVIKVIKGYCEPILKKIDDIKSEEEPVVLDNFYNYIQHDTEGKQEMEQALEKYKEDSQIDDYTSQKAINEIYMNFIIRLIKKSEDEDLTIDDGKAMEYMKYVNENTEDYYEENIKSWLSEFILYEFFTLVGCRIEYSMERNEDGKWESVPSYIITIKDKNMRTYEIETSNSIDYGSYVNDTYGHCELRRVDYMNVTMRAKDAKLIKLPRLLDGKDIRHMSKYDSIDLLDLDENMEFEIKDVLEVSYNGGDGYYPSGYSIVNMDIFDKPNARQKDRKVVWIFKGDSASGKSYLSSMIRSRCDKKVYETDTHSELPSFLNYDIIVIGNKHDFTIDEVKERIAGDNEIVVVDFSIQ